MKKIILSQNNLTILCGAIASLMTNWFFFLNDTAKPIGKMQFSICVYLPFLLFMPIALIAILIKSILRGNVSATEWGIENAKDILLKDDKSVNRFLARLYLILNKPILLLGGWAAGSGIFYYLAETYNK